ncbi:helix-turn-helix transcriptional regulator [Candidatus Woesearchaeota archaeon]|nr:helix-turn-helix transcriptional regulator [Candidatus Woesearchaeota archaeon]
MEHFVYFDKEAGAILDFWPTAIPQEERTLVRRFWSQEIPRKILILLSEEENVTTPRIKQQIGHSMSTLHENLRKMELAGLIETQMIYVGNKQKVIRPKVIFVSKNPKLRERIKTLLNKGLWVDSKRTNAIIRFLDSHPDQHFTVEEISRKTEIPVDEVRVLLDNWDSQITRAFSHFLEPVPFEKRILYRSKRRPKTG